MQRSLVYSHDHDYCVFFRNKYYRINFASSLAAGKEVTVTVDSFFTHALKPYPTQIAQAEKQFVQFFGNAHFYSPYKTTTQTTTVNCASSTIESYTKTVKPVSQSDSTITYGPFENKGAFSQVHVDFIYILHYELSSFVKNMSMLEN